MNTLPWGENSPVFQILGAIICSVGKIVVASVAGPAVGIDMTLLLHCDLVYAANTASFSLPFTQLGLCPERPRVCCCSAWPVIRRRRKNCCSAKHSTPPKRNAWAL